MKLKKIYEEIIKKGIEADPRSKKEIDALLKEKKEVFNNLDKLKKEIFDRDCLFNPFADTRILNGDPDSSIRSVIVGIDVGGAEILLVDRLKEKGVKIDLIISHHPQGKAYASFYDVMDLQIDVFTQQGLSIALAEDLIKERKAEVERRVSAANHQRPVDIAKWLKINLISVHTPADNLAYRYIEQTAKKNKPKRLKDIVDMLLDIPEYRQAASLNNPPKIFVGNKKAKVSKLHIEFTGGTEGPKDVYKRLAQSGVDTIIAMHQSEEHFKKCREAHINVVVASHIASDSVGINLMLDHILSKEKLKVYEFSGFKRFPRKHK